jgi:hypothetical protein
VASLPWQVAQRCWNTRQPLYIEPCGWERCASSAAGWAFCTSSAQAASNAGTPISAPHRK